MRPQPARAWLALALAWSAAACTGCGDPAGEIEFAPNVSAYLVEPPRVQPEIGPWFVDRAHDFGVDVVTRCGSPDKPSLLHSLGSGVALFDVDGDGDLDLFVAPGSEVKGSQVVCAGGPWLFRNDGPGRWVDVTARSGLIWTGWAQGVAVADYDADGDLDLYVTQHGPDTLWQNQGDGTFRDVTARAGFREDYWGVAATWGDADGDGRPDLYVCNYVAIDALDPPPLHDHVGGVKVFQGPGMLPGQPDQLWRNRGDGTFEDVTGPAGLHDPDAKGMSALFADLDGDGMQDLYVVNDAQPKQLFRNRGGGRFHDVALDAGAALNRMGGPEGSMGIEVGDLNRDGRLDLVYSNFLHEGSRALLALGPDNYRDESVNSRLSVMTEPFVGWGLILADFDDDGWPDLFQANGHVYPNTPVSRYDQPPLFLRNIGRAELAFEDVTASWGPDLDSLRSGRGVAVGDIDGDGDLDLVMTTIDGPLRLLVNEGVRFSHAAEVRLVGRPPNREAIGARVEIQARGQSSCGIVRRGGSFMAASDVVLHFGLGPETTIDRLVVCWPDGTTSTHCNLPGDARLVIQQGDLGMKHQPFLISASNPSSEP
jgi:hypothetical protein